MSVIKDVDFGVEVIAEVVWMTVIVAVVDEVVAWLCL